VRKRSDRIGMSRRLALLAAAAGVLAACTASAGEPPTAGPASGPQRGPQAQRIVGPLHTDGTRVVDADGQTVRFTGVDVVGLQSGSGNFVGNGPVGPCGGWRILPSDEFDLIEAWGFNSVRIGISWSNLEPNAPQNGNHTYNQPYIQYLDTVVKAFTGRGIAVILQMAHSKWSPAFTNIPTPKGIRCRGYGMPGWLYPDAASITIPQAKAQFFSSDSIQAGYSDAWKYVAGRYASNPMVVGLDMMNEPYVPPGTPPSTYHLDAFYAKLGAAIRTVNQRALLIFQDTQDLGNGEFGVTTPPPFHGVVYSFHLYVDGWQPKGLQRTQDYLARSKSWAVPLWIGEFDAFGGASNTPQNPSWQADLRTMMDFCRQQDIGWSLFAYSSGALLVSGTSNPQPGLLPLLQAGY
jgi:endoglycosylceramidase